MNQIKRITRAEDFPDTDPRRVTAGNAYWMNDHPVYFDFFDRDKVVIYGLEDADDEALDALIDEFRFYNYHVTFFFSPTGRLLRTFEPVALTKVRIDSLQPSQFYVNQSKLEVCGQWLEIEDELLIPVAPYTNHICDGHTRLYAAVQKGITHCYTYVCEDAGAYLDDFVRMAQERGIHSISDLQPLPEEDYRKLWHQFCDDYFSAKQND